MKTFLITGYPRSRTAWLSTFLTYGPSFCFHEPGCYQRVDKFPSIFSKIGTEFVGVSEARAVAYFDRFMELFPETRVVVVRRNRDDVIKSLKRWGFDFDSRQFDQSLAHVSKFALEVPFENMPVSEIWNYCLPGAPTYPMRQRMLERVKIELTDAHVAMHHNVNAYLSPPKDKPSAREGEAAEWVARIE